MARVAGRRLMMIAMIVVLLVLFGVLALAWYDGGREDLRLITTPVTLAEPAA